MKRHLAYLKAVVRHKWFVFLACFRFGVPVWTAILHDWDKFMPDEWLPYARTFYKPDGSKQYVESVEFARACLKHQHRNKHHWQWWLIYDVTLNSFSLRDIHVLVWDRGIAQQVVQRNNGGVNWYELRDFPADRPGTIEADPMSNSARCEMLADWFGAGRAYNADWTPLEPRKWYEKNKDKMILHPDTRAWVEAELLRQEDRYKRLERFKALGF